MRPFWVAASSVPVPRVIQFHSAVISQPFSATFAQLFTASRANIAPLHRTYFAGIIGDNYWAFAYHSQSMM